MERGCSGKVAHPRDMAAPSYRAVITLFARPETGRDQKRNPPSVEALQNTRGCYDVGPRQWSGRRRRCRSGPLSYSEQAGQDICHPHHRIKVAFMIHGDEYVSRSLPQLPHLSVLPRAQAHEGKNMRKLDSLSIGDPYRRRGLTPRDRTVTDFMCKLYIEVCGVRLLMRLCGLGLKARSLCFSS